MEAVHFPADPSDAEILRDISYLVGSLPNSDTCYSSLISFFKELIIRVELRRDSSGEEILSYTFVMERSALQVIQTLLACPSWTHGQFVFCKPGLDDLGFEIFSLLRSSRSLSTLDIQLKPFYHNPLLGTLILNVLGNKYYPEDAERLALCFSRNSVLKSSTLVMYSTLNSQTWEMVLRPFTTSLKSDANVALKELVVLEIQFSAALDGTSGEAIANLLRCDTTLEKLEVRLSYTESYMIVSKLLAKALAVNHILKDFSCSLARLQELVGVFIPDSSRHLANSHLRRLKLVPTLVCQVEDYMKELSRMLELNTTLKHVEVVLGGFGNRRKIWEVISLKAPGHERVCTQDMLELMTRNELRLNTSLQSLVVGYWKLLRVGVEWQMIYGGPCLAMELLTAEYDVKVKMRQ